MGVDVKIGYYNHAFDETHALTVTGATVETGTLANLRVPQLDQRVTVRSSGTGARVLYLSLIHISEPTRPRFGSRMPSSA